MENTLAYVDRPSVTKTKSFTRLTPDELGVKLLVLEVRVKGDDHVGVDVLLVVVNQSLLFN